MPMQLLGGITPEQFLAEYWQKKPLLIRQAWTDFPELIDLARLTELAGSDDAESRLIQIRNGKYELEHGPISERRLQKLPETDWTLLVSNVNHHVDHVSELLYRFNFLPYYRLDDLMISYAPPGGTVGPHYDSYDVFLLQVGGKKRWQISSDDAGNFVEDAPIRVLKDFNSEQEWVLEHGDMLYLPPKYAHYGVALEPGMTYSIGFRAPKTQEIAGKFLEFVQDELCLDGMYADPDRKVRAHPGEIDDDFIASMAAMLKQIEWDDATVRRFVGRYFTEPKPHVFFDTPDDPLNFDDFAAQVAESGVVLDLKTQMLFESERIYINGDEIAAEPGAHPVLQQLADARALPAGEYDDDVLEALYACYDYGFLHPAG
ncbi:cupin domain-containing protein [Jeongeupia naejangsanensis]|uniref:Cupin domain-containing protein n=1 Tax=Jeongeupia naejangsanensis TaxID=613195 RepID=A0ABS2BH19_9NEIS|nr:cupin domain-containing protein [Jeongeupia naejangsanensis]MBM3114913.1 cupin domain-containing protein [Jeongeupia naejangsanensis]